MTQPTYATVDPSLDGAISPDDLSRPLYGASMGQAVKRFFKNYAKFSGRASRSEFWYTELFLFLIGLVPSVLYIIGLTTSLATTQTTINANGISEVSATGGTAAGIGLIAVGGILGFLIGLAVLIPTLALWWRRLHDGNNPGPFYFMNFIPAVGTIIVLVFACLPSKPEGRRFDLPRTP